MNDWQPIETAPKDGTRILAFGLAYAELAEDGERWCVSDTNKPRLPFIATVKWIEGWYDKEVNVGEGLYRKERTQGYAYWAPHAHAFNPTHWQPLPEPPTA